jgi:hypothetical protein
VQILRPKRLRQVAVHTSVQTPFGIAFEGMRSQRDNLSVAARLLLPQPDGSGTFEAIHFGHLQAELGPSTMQFPITL